MDGKQARRTKSGSPLGEVVDHACDALSMCIYPLIVMDIFGVGHRSRDARRDLYDDDDDGEGDVRGRYRVVDVYRSVTRE